MLGERAEAGIGREDVRRREAAIEIGCDGLRFEEFDIAVAQHRHLAEGMDGKDLRRVQRLFREHVFDALLLADHASGPRVGRPN